MHELDPRKQRLLRAIVIEYVTGAEPIASEMLVQKYDLGVKSATVRNELAEMSELGYLEQPHTSAGRIPSDSGYRFYVDRLIVEKVIDEGQQRVLRDATEDTEALQDLLRDTVKVLSRATAQLGVATTTKDSSVTVRTAIVSALGPTQALLVVALSNGHIENRMIECPKNLTLEDIGATNEALRLQIVGNDLKTLTKSKPLPVESPVIEKLLALVWTQLRAMAKQLTRGKLITEGEEFLFSKPEFQRDATALAELFRQLDETDVLYDAVSPKTDVVTIGKENRSEQLHRFSVVRKGYYIGDQEVGVVAIVGPTRMDYDGSIPLVNFTADALSRSLTRFFG
ncbi:MAG: heat-inducible transcription repressor HrcA [Armatimonadetes bacterium]|nr:heat-inducible transcription repressor HrcA [Armatimonadota bacterium]MBS1700636.1 heat-inducible transcription repressor HrcA [Armatimonadota bacterium]MBS1728881.1 heat-inducible transcription repressor HrcA [Armatimonadota bacterium]